MEFVITFVDILFTILFWAVIARVLLSWFPIPQDNQLVVLLYEVTDPLLGTVGRILGPFSRLGMFDITPIVTIFLLDLLKRIILTALQSTT